MAKGRKGGRGGGGKDTDLTSVLNPNELLEDIEDVVEAFGNSIPDLQAAFDDLKITATKTKKEFAKAAKEDRVTSKAATMAFKRMKRDSDRLHQVMDQVKKGVITPKEAAKLIKPMRETAKAFIEERKVIKANTKSKAAEAKETARVAEAEKKVREEEIAHVQKLREDKRKERAASASDKKEEERSLIRDYMSKRREEMVGKISDYGHGGGLGASKFGGGAIGSLTELGPWGVAAAAVLATVTHAFNKQQDAIKQGTEWLLNYNRAAGGFIKVQNDMVDALNISKQAAADWGGDTEAAQAAVVKMVTQTGMSADKLRQMIDTGSLKQAMGTLQTMEKEGVQSVADSMDQAIEIANTSKRDIGDVIKEMEDVTGQARAMQDETKQTVTMHGFYKAIENIRQSVDALTYSQKGLAKSLRFSLQVATKVGLVSDRAAKASQNLIQGLANEEEGFAMMDLDSNLEAAIKAGGVIGEDAKKIQEMRKAGTIDDELAARMFKKAGGYTTAEVIGNTLQNVLERGGGNVRAVTAQLGIPMEDLDSIKMISELMTEMQKNPGKNFSDIISALSPAEQGDFKKLVDQTAQANADPLQKIATSLDGIFATVTKGLPDLLTNISHGIDDIVKGINTVNGYIARLPWFSGEKTEREKLEDAARDKTSTAIANALTAPAVASVGQAVGSAMQDAQNQAYANAFKNVNFDALRAKYGNGTQTVIPGAELVDTMGTPTVTNAGAGGGAPGVATINVTGTNARGDGVGWISAPVVLTNGSALVQQQAALANTTSTRGSGP